jgi:glycosyltransferase involved in cell wall biosynthesis
MEEVMVPSAGTREQLLSHGLPLEKMKPLPRWVDTDQFSPDKRIERFWLERGLHGGLTLLYVGRVSKEKALDLLVSAFRTLVDDGVDVSLAIIGDGPYREEMHLALAGYPVLFTGYLHGEELQKAYASADIFVFPSATDTFGNVVLEAQASGLPVIVSDAGGPRELIIEEETGLVFSAGNLDELVAMIMKMAGNRLVLSLMGENARAFVLAKAPDTTETYSTILHTGPPTASELSATSACCVV